MAERLVHWNNNNINIDNTILVIVTLLVIVIVVIVVIIVLVASQLAFWHLAFSQHELCVTSCEFASWLRFAIYDDALRHRILNVAFRVALCEATISLSLSLYIYVYT